MTTERPNVVLVVMDTARAREYEALSGTGHVPTYDQLREGGVEYSRAYSSSPWTLPSHASLFTGTYPSKHGARADHPRLNEGRTTLAEAFSDSGYETVGVSNNTWVSEEFGLARGFETFYKTWQLIQTETDLGGVARTAEGGEIFREFGRELIRGNPVANVANAIYGKFLRKRGDDGARRTNRLLQQWFEKREANRPFFLFVNYLEPHLEYRPPEEHAAPFLPDGVSYEDANEVPQDAWRYIAGDLELTDRDFEILQALYRAEISYLDTRLAEIRELLADHAGSNETIFVLTSDHGENIGDHGLMDHQYALTETLVRVPLVIEGDGFEEGVRTSRLVNLLDLVPTLLDAADIDSQSLRRQSQGNSFYPEIDDEREHVIAEYLAPQPSLDALRKRVGELSPEAHEYDRRLRAIVTDRYKFVRSSSDDRWLYEIESDPDETMDISDVEKETADRLNDVLETWLKSFDHAETTEDVAVSASTKRRLEELGYLR